MDFRLLVLGAAVVAGCTSVNATEQTFADTRWKVSAINGQRVPASHMYQVRFGDGRIAGRFGCNQFSGAYSIRGSEMSVDDIASTLIGCPEPAATHETQGFAVLGQPMKLEWESGGRLTLANRRGSIGLERLD